MKSANKTIKPLILSLVILLLILAAASYLFAEHIIKIGVETAATKALGVGVYIKDVDLSIFKGTVEFKDMVVRNPAGYTYENLLELDDGRVTANVNSLLGDTVRIKQLALDGVDLVIEQKVLSNNLQDVISTIPAKGEAGSEAAAKKLHIDDLEITNIKVKAKLLPVPGKADTITLNLGPIRMTNLGADNKLSTALLTSKIMLAIADGVAKEGVGVLPEDIVNTVKSTLDKTLGVGKAAAEEAEELIETGKDLVEGFKGLLKPGEEE